MNFLEIAYLALLFISCGYASIFGGRTGKIGTGIFIVASFLSLFAATRSPLWLTTSVGVLIVDLLCLSALSILALKSNRFWPIWAMGFQVAAVVSHFGMVLAPGIMPKAYQAIVAFWSVPILAVMVAGTSLDRNYERRLRQQS